VTRIRYSGTGIRRLRSLSIPSPDHRFAIIAIIAILITTHHVAIASLSAIYVIYFPVTA